jgi:5'-3' exonuclease
MMDKYESNVVEGYEADDLLAIYYNDIDPNKEMKAVIVTQDKDLLQVPAYFLNLGTERQSEYGNAGEIFCIHPAVGLANFYKQLISGDSTDTIPGIYSITGTRNSKKFAEYIQPGVDEETMYVKVRSLYYEAIGSKEDFTKRIDLDCILWEIGNLLYMRRSFDDTGWEIPV